MNDLIEQFGLEFVLADLATKAVYDAMSEPVEVEDDAA
jgi:hypothetical protein